MRDTMKPVKKFTRKLNQRFNAKQSVLERVPGVLGNGSGGLVVAGSDSFVYVTIGDKAVAVYNNRVANQIGVAVWVGYSAEEPSLYQVLSTRSISPTAAESGFNGYAPAKRYEWHAVSGGQDPLYVHARAFTPLRLGVSATVNFQTLYADLYRGYVYSGTAYLAVARQDVDFYAQLPTAAGKAALVLVTINSTGTVIQTKGAEVAIGSLTIANLPAIPAGTIFVCGAVRVYTGQTDIQDGRTNTDFWDARFATLAAVTTTNGHFITDEGGAALTQRQYLNFKGNRITAADNAGTGATDITNTALGELVMETGITLPPVPLVNAEGTDWIYGN